MSQEELTSKVAMLSQEPPLLPVSIADNIAYGLKPGTHPHPLKRVYH
jgi:ABC-type phosphate transport system ATPase subunit